MDAKKLIKENTLVLAIIFAAISLIASSISISKLWGASGQTFTLFEFLGPLPVAFLGPVLGIASILIAKFISILALGSPLDLPTILRLLPVLFAAMFFATYKNKTGGSAIIQIFVPLICMALFMLHPVGAQAWFYSLYWLIPPIAVLLLPSNLFFRSLGTTFTQHAIGGVVWIYFVNAMNPAAWIALIPVVAVERTVFAAGISASYMCVNYALEKANAVLKSLNIAPLPMPQKNKA